MGYADASHLSKVLTQFTTTPEFCWYLVATKPTKKLPAESSELTMGEDGTFFAAPVSYAGTANANHAGQGICWWPKDKAWVIWTEAGCDSSYIGGTSDLIQAVLYHPELEALPLG